MRRILFTGAGGGGTNNLIRSFRASKLDLDQFELIGSNVSNEILCRSELDRNWILPLATDSSYPEMLRKVLCEDSIDLIVPNNDREVGVVSRIRDTLPCKVFLPNDETVQICQDKHKMYVKLSAGGIPMAKSFEITSLESIQELMDQLPGDRYWIRPKIGAGSKGATWVRTAEQARQWIGLWCDLRGFEVEEFTVSEFLPGRDYAFQSVWSEGEMVVGKLVERLAYVGAENRLSGMASSPSIGRTLRDEVALETVQKAVKMLMGRPHGNFNFDLKGGVDGTMCITECNVGRFCMITPIFDLTGKYNTVEMYVRSAFGEVKIPDEPIDIVEDIYLLRELDNHPVIIEGGKMRSFGRVPES